jgi:hypothetical protein
LDLRVIADLGLKPEAIVTRLLRSQSQIGASEIRCGAATYDFALERGGRKSAMRIEKSPLFGIFGQLRCNLCEIW